MKIKSKEELVNKIIKKLAIDNDKQAEQILLDFLKPSIAGFRAKPGSSISKVGGFPLLPLGFKTPTCGSLPLQFFGQIDFAQIAEFDTDNIFPDAGLLVIFMYLSDEWGEFTIPHFNNDHLKAYYFEDLSKLAPCEDEAIRCSSIKETCIQFKQYFDFPEHGDPNLSPDASQFERQHDISHQVLPQLFKYRPIPCKLLGYPTDDAQNTYPSWYFFDKEINIFCPGPTEEFYREAQESDEKYKLLLQIDLTWLRAWGREKDGLDFGGISIGINPENLHKRDFSKLVFSYTIS